MNSSGDAPIKRVAKLSFSAPPRVNRPTGMSYTDIDAQSGERIQVPVVTDATRSAGRDVFAALLSMTLVQLANRLRVNWGDPPAWVPEVEEALDASVRLTSSILHACLLETDGAGDELEDIDMVHRPLAGSKEAPGSTLSLPYSVPVLFSKVRFAFETLELQDAKSDIQHTFITPVDRSQLAQRVADSTDKPLAALRRIFGVEDVESAELSLSVAPLPPGDEAPALGEIEDLTLATCIAWAANVETSQDPNTPERLGLWLCDRNEKPVSPTLAVKIHKEADTVNLNLDVAPSIGGAELIRMNEVLDLLVRLSKS